MIAAAKVAAIIYITIAGVGTIERRGSTTPAGCHRYSLPPIWDDEGRPVTVRVVCKK